MEEDIRRCVETLRRRADALPRQRFFILHFNVWVEEMEPGGKLIPSELGLVEVSLGEGVGEVFHQLIDPGEPPRGYKGEMRIYSDKYHKIWLDNEELSDDYAGMMEEIERMLRVRDLERPAGENIVVEGFQSLEPILAQREEERREKDRAFLPIFVMPKTKEVCRRSLAWLQEQAEVTFDQIGQ